jgi:hypothetical protein
MKLQMRGTAAAAAVLAATVVIGLPPSIARAAVTIFEDQRQFRYYVDGFFEGGTTPWHHENTTGVGNGQDWSIGANGFGTNMGTASYNITYGGRSLVTPLYSGFGPSSPGIGGQASSMIVDAGVGLAIHKYSGPYTTGWLNYGGGTTFEIVEPTPWTIVGTAASDVYQAGGRVVVGVQLFNIVSSEFVFDFQREGGAANFSEDFSGSGVLQPGYWQFNYVTMVEYSDFYGSGPYDINATSLLHATFAVPEPASAALVALPALACLRRRRR